jgi:diguanylate cyclase (GGDEF)-like protein
MDGQQGARSDDYRLKLVEAAVDFADPGLSAGLGLVVRDLARAVGAKTAVLAVHDHARINVDVLAEWGEASRDGLLPSRPADGFVGRALKFGRAAVEPISLDIGSTLALGAPVKSPSGPSGVLCAAFAGDPPHDLAKTLWLAESYARLASLCLEDPAALAGLLPGGRIDGLTGCLTQAAFLQELGRELARAERHGHPLSCSFIDLDRFKRVNDRYGHLHGSRVLASIAAVLRAGTRTGDVLGRYGGDEFVILLPDTDEASALELSGRLRSSISATMVNLPRDAINASIGVAQWRRGSTVEALLGAADAALLAAKAAGGGTTIGAGTLASPATARHDQCRVYEYASPVIADTTNAASVDDVLEVSAHFEEGGGASVELTAWELDLDLSLVVSAWSHAISEGLLVPAGIDPASGEEMWRLSERGWTHRAAGAR